MRIMQYFQYFSISYNLLGLLFFLILTNFSCVAMAETEVGGNITESTTWTLENSPYVVTSTVQVYQGIRLTIEPGTIIKFQQNTGLLIGGELYSVGTENETILFTSIQINPSAGDWEGIKFVGTADNAIFDEKDNYLYGSIMKYCKVEFAKTGINCFTASPFITFCNISNNSGAGIKCYNCRNKIIISNNLISENTNSGRGGGIDLYLTDLITIKNNTIEHNTCNHDMGGGIYASVGTINILQNSILHNSIDSLISSYDPGIGGGIYANAKGSIIGNDIKYNSAPDAGGGIYAGVTTIEYNLIEGNSAGNKGGGICIDSRSGVVQIVRNEIKNNTALLGSGILNSPEPLNYEDVHIVVEENNIYDNYYNSKPLKVKAPNNYWGTNDLDEIENKIYHYYDDINMGEVTYKPIALQPYDFSGGSLNITIRDEKTLLPVQGATVNFLAGTGMTDEKGFFIIENILPGVYDLTISAPKYIEKKLADIEITPGVTTTLDVVMTEMTTGTISGQVLKDFGLTPLENITVKLKNNTQEIEVTNTDVNGFFHFNEVTHGDYFVNFESPNYFAIPQPLSVEIGTTTNLIMVALSNSTVEYIRSDMYTQEQIDQAVLAAKAEKDMIIEDLNHTISEMYTKEQIEQIVSEKIQSWDINNDGKIGLEEIIYWLEIISAKRN